MREKKTPRRRDRRRDAFGGVGWGLQCCHEDDGATVPISGIVVDIRTIV